MRIHICEYARPDEVQILPPDAKICPWCGSDLEVEALRAQFSDLEQELETWKTNAQDVHEANDKLRERLSEYDAKYSADMERMEGIAKGLSMKLDAANERVRELEGALKDVVARISMRQPQDLAGLAVVIANSGKGEAWNPSHHTDCNINGCAGGLSCYPYLKGDNE